MTCDTKQLMALAEVERLSKLAPVTNNTLRVVAMRFNVRYVDLKESWEIE